MLGFGKIARSVFGTPNDRKIKATRPLVEQINALETEFEALSDEGLKDKTKALADRAKGGESLDAIPAGSLCQLPRGRQAGAGPARLRRGS